MYVNGLFHAAAALLEFKEPHSTYCIVRWVGPTTHLDVMVRGKLPNRACISLL
jgi:hypothetical protein